MRITMTQDEITKVLRDHFESRGFDTKGQFDLTFTAGRKGNGLSVEIITDVVAKSVTEFPKLQETSVTELPKLQETSVTEIPKLQETSVTELPKLQETSVTELPKLQETSVLHVVHTEEPEAKEEPEQVVEAPAVVAEVEAEPKQPEATEEVAEDPPFDVEEPVTEGAEPEEVVEPKKTVSLFGKKA